MRSAVRLSLWLLVPLALAASACSSRNQNDGDASGTSESTGDDCPVGHGGCPCPSMGECDYPYSCDSLLDICVSCRQCTEDEHCVINMCWRGCCRWSAPDTDGESESGTDDGETGR